MGDGRVFEAEGVGEDFVVACIYRRDMSTYMEKIVMTRM